MKSIAKSKQVDIYMEIYMCVYVCVYIYMHVYICVRVRLWTDVYIGEVSFYLYVSLRCSMFLLMLLSMHVYI